MSGDAGVPSLDHMDEIILRLTELVVNLKRIYVSICSKTVTERQLPLTELLCGIQWSVQSWK